MKRKLENEMNIISRLNEKNGAKQSTRKTFSAKNRIIQILHVKNVSACLRSVFFIVILGCTFSVEHSSEWQQQQKHFVSMQRIFFASACFFLVNLRCHRVSSFSPISSECPKLHFRHSFCVPSITFPLFSLRLAFSMQF